MSADVVGFQNRFLCATESLRHSADPEVHLKAVKLQLERIANIFLCYGFNSAHVEHFNLAELLAPKACSKSN